MVVAMMMQDDGGGVMPGDAKTMIGNDMMVSWLSRTQQRRETEDCQRGAPASVGLRMSIRWKYYGPKGAN